MGNPTAAMIVIGDEILSGRTRDINANVLAVELTARGIDLMEVRFIPDIENRIVDTVNSLRSKFDHVFTSGGIGPTHDDITADCVAKAFNMGIGVREDARAILATNYANPETELNEDRLRMARVPDDAILIANPVSKAPGFSVENVHVMAGVPKIFKAMLDGLLPGLSSGTPTQSRSIRVERPEGIVAGPLRKFAGAHPEISVGCYPFNVDGVLGCNIVLRSTDEAVLDAAAEQFNDAISKI